MKLPILYPNSSIAVKRCLDRKKMLKILQLHGVSVPRIVLADEENELVSSRYMIPVFQMDSLGIFQSAQSKIWLNETMTDQCRQYEQIDQSYMLNEWEKRVKKHKNLAIRAIYALGLDYGVVETGSLPNGNAIVLNVIPSPKLNEEIGLLFEKAIEAYLEQAMPLFYDNKEIVLGADPEFMLRNESGEMVLASDFFNTNGEVGCDAIWAPGRDRNEKPIAELRPQPDSDPRQLVINLYRTMLRAVRKIDNANIDWLAGAMPLERHRLGGHIHFSNVKLDSHLIRCLDNYLTLSLTLIEHENGSKRRPKYGFLGDCRRQFHGGFEYRTPASWLISPKATKGVFALSKLIAQNSKVLTQNPLESIDVQHAYYCGNKNKLLPHVTQLWSELRQLDGYKQYEKYLESFREMVLSMQPWDESLDIRKKWRLPPYHIL